MTGPGIRNSVFRLNGLINTRKSRSSWVLIPPFVALGIVIVCFSACRHETEVVTRDLGGGSLIDCGKGSYYPRFIAEVNPYPVGTSSSCAWTLSGLPSSEYTVQVIFEAVSHENGSNVVKKVGWTALDQSGVFVSVELRVPNGGEILSSFSGNLAKDWDSWGSGGQDFFYSPSLKDLHLPEKVEVLVTGSIENPGHLTGELSIRVELHAGGKRI